MPGHQVNKWVNPFFITSTKNTTFRGFFFRPDRCMWRHMGGRLLADIKEMCGNLRPSVSKVTILSRELTAGTSGVKSKLVKSL